LREEGGREGKRDRERLEGINLRKRKIVSQSLREKERENKEREREKKNKERVRESEEIERDKEKERGERERKREGDVSKLQNNFT
jgi:hypothetical protein